MANAHIGPGELAEYDSAPKKSIVAVVPSEGIVDTGTLSYMFMMAADVPLSATVGKPYGMIQRAPKGPNYVDPWRLSRGEEGAIGDDGVSRWSVFLGRGGEQQFYEGVDDDGNGEGLAQLVGDMPECIVLVNPGDLGDIQTACNTAGVIDLQVIHYEGQLRTSR